MLGHTGWALGDFGDGARAPVARMPTIQKMLMTAYDIPI